MSLSLNKVSQTYFDKLFVAQNNTALAAAVKAKTLLVDKFTMPIVSMSYTQTQLLQHDVILTEMIENYRSLSNMKHLNCVVFIRPCRESINSLVNELGAPHYNHYQVFFSNVVAKGDLERIAEADEYETITQVVELFQDYLIANDNLFSVALSEDAQKHNVTIQESQSLSTLLLSLRKCPIIQYELASIEAKRLLSEILYYINSNSNNNLFDDLNKGVSPPPLLLILDRRLDPVTPLVTPWTYQSMIHELIGISKNVVTLAETGEQLTLSDSQDQFFQESMYLNYGDLTDKFQKYVDEYKRQTKLLTIENLKTQDLSELKRILTRFPEFKKLSTNILKHLNIISELDKQISTNNLWSIGELQQTLLCELESHNAVRNNLLQLLEDPRVLTSHKVKLTILYVAKYPGNEVGDLLGVLLDPQRTLPPPTSTEVRLIKNFGRHFGGQARSVAPAAKPNNTFASLFSNNRVRIQQLFNNNRSGKTDNIFMQYVPRVANVLAQIMGESEEQTTPLATMVPDAAGKATGPPQEVIIYFKGGVTYEEARLVKEAGQQGRVKFVIGGDGILSSREWLDRMCESVAEHVEAPAPDRKAQLRELL